MKSSSSVRKQWEESSLEAMENELKRVQSLLLETQPKVWESTQRNSSLKSEARQKDTPREECILNEEEYSKVI